MDKFRTDLYDRVMTRLYIKPDPPISDRKQAAIVNALARVFNQCQFVVVPADQEKIIPDHRTRQIMTGTIELDEGAQYQWAAECMNEWPIQLMMQLQLLINETITVSSDYFDTEETRKLLERIFK